MKLRREFDWFGTSGQIWILAAWAILVGILVWTPGNEVVTMDESRLLDRVYSAQRTLHEKRVSLGTASPRSIDPSDSGLIGVEWSTITTTAGDLGSKILSVKPGWAVVFRRWLDNEGLTRGDRITILSSGSFPGLAVSAIAAAESLDLESNLLVSLIICLGGKYCRYDPDGHSCVPAKRSFKTTRANACTLGQDGDREDWPGGVITLTGIGDPRRHPRDRGRQPGGDDKG